MPDIYIISKPGCTTGMILSLVKCTCERRLKPATVKKPSALAFKLSKDEAKKLKIQGCLVELLKNIPDEKYSLISKELESQ
ncbi:MAG: hypothetical protein GF365_02695 [Candidatus Buchananbacteria bacterium]|nr:hypothetical protein [Candidatus Buchananbacteria bacterium]